MSRKVGFCTPTYERPTQAYLDALERSVPHLDDAGWEHHTVFEIGNPYISAARSSMLGKALDWGADVVVFIDDDLSWEPEDLLRLLSTEGDVVGGNYRYRNPEVRYMGKPFLGEKGHPLVREDGAILMLALPAGFLKVTSAAIDVFLETHPQLRMNWTGKRNVDLFNHGVWNGTWFGEDFAFCRNWLATGNEIYCQPDLNLTHHNRNKWTKDGLVTGESFPGNYHQYLLNQPVLAKAA